MLFNIKRYFVKFEPSPHSTNWPVTMAPTLARVLKLIYATFIILYQRNNVHTFFVWSLYAQAMDLLSASTWTPFEFYGSRNTYFIPTDYAFHKLGAAQLERIFSNPTYMQNIMNNHQADRIIPSTLIREHLQYDVQTKNEIVRVFNRGDKLMV